MVKKNRFTGDWDYMGTA